MKKTYFILTVALFSLIMTSCSNSDENNLGNLTLDISGLQQLGDDYEYEGWIIVNGSPISTGRFSGAFLAGSNARSFEVDKTDLQNASKFVITIEPKNDPDPAPSKTKYLVGDFNGNSASLTTKIVGDFSNAAGSYILATPTNGGNTDEKSGIWFLKLPLPPTVGLTLPELSDGWVYEGWVVVDGKPITTGKFKKVAATDMFDGFSGTMALPNVNGNDGFFPGEDFLVNAPDGVTFPLDLSGAKAVITIEPVPDNNEAKPFTLKPLVGSIPVDARDHVNYMLDNKSEGFPTGTASRN